MSDVDPTASLVRVLIARGLTIAVAESLTGGALTAELTRPAGASAAVAGGAVVYATELKASLVGVDPSLLAEHGPVHPEVARQLADRVRASLAAGSRSADVGVATTGVAGPDPQGGREAGTVFVGVAVGGVVTATELTLSGTRAQIRAETVERAVALVAEAVRAADDDLPAAPAE